MRATIGLSVEIASTYLALILVAREAGLGRAVAPLLAMVDLGVSRGRGSGLGRGGRRGVRVLEYSLRGDGRRGAVVRAVLKVVVLVQLLGVLVVVGDVEGHGGYRHAHGG